MKNHIPKSIFFIIGAVFLLFVNSNLAKAELINQSFTLRPGWSAVFLEVDPVSNDSADLFAGIPELQSVWMWNPRTGTVEFVQDPGTLMPDQPQWMVYYPDNPILTNLHVIFGEKAYLIQRGGTADVVWTVAGEPALPDIDWKANSFNFVGFHLTPGQEPFFDQFFSPSPAHAEQDIYILNASGTWEKVQNPAMTGMVSGEAFWIYCKGSSQYTGPLSIQLEQGKGLHYGRVLVEQDVIVRNNALADASISISTSAADLPLYYWRFDPANEIAEWVTLPVSPAGLSLDIAAGSSQRLRLGVKRAGLTADQQYRSNLHVSDDNGTAFGIPASATGIDFSGLWIGDAIINKVSEPRISNTPTPTGSLLSFRLLLYVEDTGQVRLLKEVIQLWQEGGLIPDPNDLGKRIVDPQNPGQFVLLADDSLIAGYSGAALRDGQPVGRRISAANFSFPGVAIDATPSVFQPEGALGFSVHLAKDNPHNPFVHLYHPDHLAPEGTDPVEKVFDITRTILMTFKDEDTDGNPITAVPSLSWGSSDIGGVYKETITGLQRGAIRIEGIFRLHKVCSDDLLLP